MSAKFEILEHPADVGFAAYGATLEELFANAALALGALACAPQGIKERDAREISATGSEIESLLYAWLAEILAVADASRFVFCRVEVTCFGAGEIRGLLHGENFEKTRHAAGTYIKAITYHQFEVRETSSGWRARVFLDV